MAEVPLHVSPSLTDAGFRASASALALEGRRVAQNYSAFPVFTQTTGEAADPAASAPASSELLQSTDPWAGGRLPTSQPVSPGTWTQRRASPSAAPASYGLSRASPTRARGAPSTGRLGETVPPADAQLWNPWLCLLYTSPSPRDRQKSRMPSSA